MLVVVVCFNCHLSPTSLLPYNHDKAGKVGARVLMGAGRQAVIPEQGNGRDLGQRDNERPVRFRNFLFNSVQILSYYCFFSAGPTVGPGRPDARALKLSL